MGKVRRESRRRRGRSRQRGPATRAAVRPRSRSPWGIARFDGEASVHVRKHRDAAGSRPVAREPGRQLHRDRPRRRPLVSRPDALLAPPAPRYGPHRWPLGQHPLGRDDVRDGAIDLSHAPGELAAIDSRVRGNALCRPDVRGPLVRARDRGLPDGRHRPVALAARTGRRRGRRSRDARGVHASLCRAGER